MSLDNRDYMRNGPYRTREENSGPQVLFAIIIINIVFYVIASPGGELFSRLALSFNGSSFDPMMPVQLLSAGLLHGSFMHLLLNMWGLYLFGTLVLPHIGPRRFAWLYLIGILSGNLLFLLFNLNGYAVLIGASGAVCAVMIAAAMLEPDRQFVLLIPPIPMRTRTLVVCYTILEILMLWGGMQPHVAHLAHLGGFVGGYLFLKLLRGVPLRWDPFARRSAPRNGGRPRYTYTFRTSPPPREGNGGPVSSQELDMLLDKISREGINALSEYELARLRQARREMRGE